MPPTMLFEAGIPPQEAQALLRHAQIATTMDIYTDIRENKRQEIFNKVIGIDIAWCKLGVRVPESRINAGFISGSNPSFSAILKNRL